MGNGSLTRRETLPLQPEVSSSKEALPDLSVRKVCLVSFPCWLTTSKSCFCGSTAPSAPFSSICTGREGEMPQVGL